MLLVLLASCKKEKNNEVIDLGYTYFPNTERSYIIYKVDSIHYGSSIETYSFQVKELLASTFYDNEGDLAMKVERYQRSTSGSPWVLKNVWSQKITTSTAERVESNVRFIEMSFPLSTGKTWKGNAYNQLGSWDYHVAYYDQLVNLSAMANATTMRIDKRNNVNLVDDEVAYDIYAREVGLVYRKWQDLNHQDGYTTGVDVTYKMLARGTQ
jgi:hypothetical protein